MSLRRLVAILLSLCLGLFLADGVVSLADSSLIILFDSHPLSAVSGLLGFFGFLMVIVMYGLMGLTPLIPKRLFLPIPLFVIVAELLLAPFSIYAYTRMQQAVWGLSLCQVIVGLIVLYRVRGGYKFRWPLVAEEQLEARRFSWRNLAVFLLANVFVLLPAVMAYVVVCAALAMGHFSEGFMALRPGGLTVQVRTYIRNDGKTIQLFPMAHVADSAFYEKVAQAFSSNSIILMEGVTDNKNLITNKVTYKRMATALGLGEQHEDFNPTQGVMVQADVDVEEFATNTIDLLNLVMLIHAKGVTPETVLKLMLYPQPARLQEQLFDDLLKKRNRHLLQQLQLGLTQSEHIIVPWGALHMPEIAREIQKSGFHLDKTEDFVVIRFRYWRPMVKPHPQAGLQK